MDTKVTKEDLKKYARLLMFDMKEEEYDTLLKEFNQFLENGVFNIKEYNNFAKEAERSINDFKKYQSDIEKAVAEGEQTLKTGMFIEYDYNLLWSIPKRAQQVISRNAKKFNDIASKTELDANEEKQLDSIIKRQKELIEDLWNKIEADKKAYFEREAKAKEEWNAKAEAEMKALREKYGDEEIPF